MKNEEKKKTPLLEDKDKDKENIEFDLENDFERAAIKRRRYPFFALLALVLLALAVILIFNASRKKTVDALVELEDKANEVWQGAFSSKESFEKAKASSVSIISEGKICSGFVFSSDGWIATAEGIVNEYVEGQIEVCLSDGRSFAVDCFKQDRECGLLLLKIKAEGLTPASFGNGSPSVGEELFTFCSIGNDAFSSSLFCGRLSHAERTAVITRRDESLSSLSLLQIAFLLTEEGVGAPIYNASGELVGIAIAQSNAYGERFMVNYAIPSNKALDALSALYSDKIPN